MSITEVPEPRADLALGVPHAHAPVLDFSGESLADKWQMAEVLSRSALVPKDFQGKPGDILIVADLGGSLGLSVAHSLQTIACIKGRPVIWGDGMLGVVRRNPLCEWIKENEIGSCANCSAPITLIAGDVGSEWRHDASDDVACAELEPGKARGVATLADNDRYGYRCSTKRRGEPNIISNTFTIADAKRAKLLGKDGPWTDYGPRRMCRMRARSWTCRDAYPDVLKGLAMREEIVDVPDAVRDAIRNAPTRTDALKAALAANTAVAIAASPLAGDPAPDERPLEERITAALDAAAGTDPDFKPMKGTQLRTYVNRVATESNVKPWDLTEIEKATPQGRLLRENIVAVLRAVRERGLRAALAAAPAEQVDAAPAAAVDVVDEIPPSEEAAAPDLTSMTSEQLREFVRDRAAARGVSEAALVIIERVHAEHGLTVDNAPAVLAEIEKRGGAK